MNSLMYFEKAPIYLNLANIVDTIWQSQMSAGDSAFIAPDGTSDIIIKVNSSGIGIFLCGVMTKSISFKVDENVNYFGIRFKPGVLNLFLKIGHHNNQLISIDQFFSSRNQIEDLMSDQSKNFFKIEKLIFDELLKMIDEDEFRRKIQALNEYSKFQYGEVSVLAERMGISRRQYCNRFKQYFGYDPRFFLKLKKINDFLKNASLKMNSSLSELAQDSGFYDQSDLSHAVKEISGLTPKQLISQVYNTKT